MNLFGFQKSIFNLLNSKFDLFLNENINTLKNEFLLPEVIGRENIYIDSTDEKWFGVTYKEDSEIVRKKIKNMVLLNTYPSPLFI